MNLFQKWSLILAVVVAVALGQKGAKADGYCSASKANCPRWLERVPVGTGNQIF